MLMHADKKRAQGRRREEGRAGEQQTKAVTLVSKQHWLCADASEYCWLVTVKILFSLTIWGRLVIAPGRLLSRLLEHPYRPSHPTHVSLHAKLLCSSWAATIAFRFKPRAHTCQFCLPWVAARSIIVYFSGCHISSERPASGGLYCWNFFLSHYTMDDVSLSNTHKQTMEMWSLQWPISWRQKQRHTSWSRIKLIKLERNLVSAAFRLIRH